MPIIKKDKQDFLEHIAGCQCERCSSKRPTIHFSNGGKATGYDYDYEDIGQFSMKDENWKYFTTEDFREIGKEITDTAFNGDLDVAYESIVKQRDFESGGELTEYEDEILKKAGRKMNERKVYQKGGETENYIIKRTEVPCPNCMKKRVIQESEDRAYCDGCGQGYVKKTNSNSLRYEKSLSEEFKKGGITKDKAKLMLEEGVANGKPLTSKQKNYFRSIANDAKYSEGGYTKKGVKLRTALSQMDNVKKANGMFVYNPYYEKWGWINDEQLDKGILPYRVAVNYKKNDTLGKGSLENVNDLIVVREGYYMEGGITKESIKREKSRKSKKMKKGGSVLDGLTKKWNLQDEIMYLEQELKDTQYELDSLFSEMNQEAGQKGESWNDDDGNRYGEKMNKVENRKESIKKLIKVKTEKWEELEQS